MSQVVKLIYDHIATSCNQDLSRFTTREEEDVLSNEVLIYPNRPGSRNSTVKSK